ncbi:MAG TPA: MaoC family dehydratase [Jiangellaceae bacterium]
MSTEHLAGETTGPLVLRGIDDLRAKVGTSLGTSRWVVIDQESIDSFAQLTGDTLWIHVDPERAAQGRFGATIGHGFMTLSLATALLWDVATVEGYSLVLNYGLNRVRFPAPVPVGSRLRLHAELAALRELDGGVEVVYHLEYEIEGRTKPPCVADLIFHYYE